jgi:GTPase SAR1 family protein
MSDLVRVLIFGTVGTGKTSLCNTLTNEARPVSNSAKGVTFESYTYQPIEFEGKKLILTDTVGLNECDQGTVPATDALKGLVELLRNSKEGYNLLIHVFRIPRITRAEKSNYEFFVKTISASKIPTILVANGCEGSQPMSQWREDNHKVLQEMGLEYADIVCTCFAQEGGLLSEIYALLRSESCQVVFNSIAINATDEAITLYDTDHDFVIVLKRAWNWLLGWTGVKQWQLAINAGVKNLLIQVGFSETEAKYFAENWKFPSK